MLCSNCSKLAFLQATKYCARCHGNVTNNISVLCEKCSSTAKQCAVCLKKIIVAVTASRKCNCGR
jgi:hypothetical protein